MDLREYIFNSYMKQLTLKPGDVEFMEKLKTHVDFRTALVNKGILGTLSETTRLLVTLLSTVVYGSQSDGPLKSSLKSTSDVLEVVNNCQFLSDALSEIASKNKEDVSGHPSSIGSAQPMDDEGQTAMDEEVTGISDLCTEEEIANDKDGKLDEWLTFLENKFESFCTIVIDCDTRDELTETLKNTNLLSKVEGPAALVYDTKISGEASSNPNVRLPPFQVKQLRRYLQCFTMLREPAGDDQHIPGDMRKRDQVIVLDGGRTGNDGAVGQAFVDTNGRSMTKIKQQFSVLYDEDSIGNRKERVRGFVQQVEGLTVFTTDGLADLPKVSRKHYTGTNYGSCIGPVRTLTYDDEKCWRISPADKKLLYGDKGKILTGGPVSSEAKIAKPTFFDGLEPVAWHFSNPMLLSEILHSFKPSLVLRAPDCDHLMIIECIKAQIPIISVVWTAHHAKLLKAKCLKTLWKCFLDPECPDLYEVGLPLVTNLTFFF